ncbi:MAG TPA: hypothetical protein VF170_12860, partial [Planctomycetaceae bacterium]
RVERVRGFELDETPQPSPGSVLVLHDDGASEAQRRFRYGIAPRVVIGSLTSEIDPAGAGDEQRLAQPFHYAELIRAVESLLGEPAPQRRAA